MNRLDRIITELKDEMDDLSFSEIIRQARDRIGLVQYRAAEHLHIPLARLKNLEIGYFRVMPSEEEIRNLCEFYNLPTEKMKEKAAEHVENNALSRKIRTMKDG